MSTERNASADPPLRRLTARSVLLSVLLGSDDMWLPTPLLLSTTALFGIAEGTSRTALSRMASAGEVEPFQGGYRIRSTDLRARRDRQDVGRAGETGPWDGSWRQVVVGLGARRTAAERAEVRRALRAARFAELREGVWLRPDNLGHAAGSAPATGSAPASAPLDIGDALVGRVTDFDTHPADLAATLWDLEGWAATALDLVARMAPLADRLERGDHTALADGFVLNAAVLRHVAVDPLLPAELLTGDWPGAMLRADFERFDAAFRRVILDHFQRHRERSRSGA